jgi:helicase MOV-10
LIRFTSKIQGNDRRVTVPHPIVVAVTFTQEHIGRYQEMIEFQFMDEQLNKAFSISRTVRAIVGDRTAHEQLKARVPYAPRVRRQREPETKVVEGVTAPSLNAIPYVTKLPRAAIPTHLLATLALSSYPTRENLESIKRGFLPKLLDSETHGRHFKALLWIEEHKMEYVHAYYPIDLFSDVVTGRTWSGTTWWTRA